MSRFRGIRRAFRLGVPRWELDEELAFHFERTVEELMDTGMPRQRAEEEAHRRFGDERRWRREIEKLDRSAETARRWKTYAEAAGANLRLALRRMRAAPLFTLGVVATFALGIGANATMFGIIDRLLLSPPAHVAEPDEVWRLAVARHDEFRGGNDTVAWVAYPDYADFAQARSFGVAAFAGRGLTVGRGADALRLNGALVTGGYFSLLGVRPALGRFFTAAEDRVGGEQVIVISHALWRSRYAGDPGVVGKTIDFGYGPYTIVGVAPKGFAGLELERVDAWLPLVAAQAAMRGDAFVENRNQVWIRMVARLRPGATPQAAEAEATLLHRRGRQEAVAADDYDPKARVLTTPLIVARGPDASSESTVARWLAGISLIVLLIACANVANLLLARGVQRRGEVAVRIALGGSRGRLLGEALTESVLFAVLGGAAALLLARWGGALLRATLLPDVVWDDTGLEARAALFALVLAVLAGAAVGIIPAVQSSRLNVLESLKSGRRGTGSPASRTRDLFTLLQTALSLMLLVGAGLFIRSLQRVGELDMGFDPRGVLMFTSVFSGEKSEAERLDFYRRATERVNALPGVEAASPDLSIPFYSESAVSLRVPGLDSIPGGEGNTPAIHVVDPAFFRAMRLDILRGRPLEPTDTRAAERVVVVNETMAKTVWPGEDALGKCLVIAAEQGAPEPPCSRVVGVVEDARSLELVEDASPAYYVPLAQEVIGDAPYALLIRVRGGDPEAMIPTLQRELYALEPSLRYAAVQPFQELIDPLARSWTLGASVFTALGVLGLVIASIGLYTVLAFSVAQRRFELGVRAALGAERRSLMGLVFRNAYRLVGMGIVLGLLATAAAASRVRPLLFETSPLDPVVLGLVVAVLLLVSAAASLAPAWRATRVDPSTALRAE